MWAPLYFINGQIFANFQNLTLNLNDSKIIDIIYNSNLDFWPKNIKKYTILELKHLSTRSIRL